MLNVNYYLQLPHPRLLLLGWWRTSARYWRLLICFADLAPMCPRHHCRCCVMTNLMSFLRRILHRRSTRRCRSPPLVVLVIKVSVAGLELRLHLLGRLGAASFSHLFEFSYWSLTSQLEVCAVLYFSSASVLRSTSLDFSCSEGHASQL